MTVTKERQEELDALFEAAVLRALRRWDKVDPQHANYERFARIVRQTIRAASPDYCVSCTYKRKTADAFTEEPEFVTPLKDLVKERQYEVNPGNTKLRINQLRKIVRAFRDAWPGGFTDAELEETTGIFLDSSKGARSGTLCPHGWVKFSGYTRQSPRGRPMKVWVMTDKARARLRPKLTLRDKQKRGQRQSR